MKYQLNISKGQSWSGSARSNLELFVNDQSLASFDGIIYHQKSSIFNETVPKEIYIMVIYRTTEQSKSYCTENYINFFMENING